MQRSPVAEPEAKPVLEGVPKEIKQTVPEALIVRANEIIREARVVSPGIVPTTVTTQREPEKPIDDSVYEATVLTAKRQGIPAAQMITTSRRISGKGPESLTRYTLFTADDDKLKIGFDRGRLIEISADEGSTRVEFGPKWYVGNLSPEQQSKLLRRVGVKV